MRESAGTIIGTVPVFLAIAAVIYTAHEQDVKRNALVEKCLTETNLEARAARIELCRYVQGYR